MKFKSDSQRKAIFWNINHFSQFARSRLVNCSEPSGSDHIPDIKIPVEKPYTFKERRKDVRELIFDEFEKEHPKETLLNVVPTEETHLKTTKLFPHDDRRTFMNVAAMSVMHVDNSEPVYIIRDGKFIAGKGFRPVKGREEIMTLNPREAYNIMSSLDKYPKENKRKNPTLEDWDVNGDYDEFSKKKFYHGSAGFAGVIVGVEGLKPVAQQEDGPRSGGHLSDPDYVYLTSDKDIAKQFAINEAKYFKDKTYGPVIYEVEMEEGYLEPDLEYPSSFKYKGSIPKEILKKIRIGKDEFSKADIDKIEEQLERTKKNDAISDKEYENMKQLLEIMKKKSEFSQDLMGTDWIADTAPRTEFSSLGGMFDVAYDYGDNSDEFSKKK